MIVASTAAWYGPGGVGPMTIAMLLEQSGRSRTTGVAIG